MCFFYQEGFLKMADEVIQWKEKRTNDRILFSALVSTFAYANRYFLEGGSFIATKTSGTGSGKPLIGARFGTIFRFVLFVLQ
jgi:hypothetical protein